MLKTLAIFLFIIGVLIFGMSYHNIDLSVNMQYGAIDKNGMGFTQDQVQMYTNGLTGMSLSAVSMISGFVIAADQAADLAADQAADLLFGIKDSHVKRVTE